jgi:hypothetical protein
MNKPTIGDPPAFKLARLAVPLVAGLAWLIWSGAAVAAEIKSPHSIACKAMTVHAFQEVVAAKKDSEAQTVKSWDANDQLADPSLVFEWRPNAPEGATIEVDGVKAELASVTDNTIIAIHGFSDPVTVKRWLFAINFGLEDVVGVNVESNAATVNGRVAEFSCSFGASY